MSIARYLFSGIIIIALMCLSFWVGMMFNNQIGHETSSPMASSTPDNSLGSGPWTTDLENTYNPNYVCDNNTMLFAVATSENARVRLSDGRDFRLSSEDITFVDSNNSITLLLTQHGNEATFTEGTTTLHCSYRYDRPSDATSIP